MFTACALHGPHASNIRVFTVFLQDIQLSHHVAVLKVSTGDIASIFSHLELPNQCSLWICVSNLPRLRILDQLLISPQALPWGSA